VLRELKVHEVTESGATCDGDAVRMTIYIYMYVMYDIYINIIFFIIN
jgi:hypothetical protein